MLNLMIEQSMMKTAGIFDPFIPPVAQGIVREGANLGSSVLRAAVGGKKKKPAKPAPKPPSKQLPSMSHSTRREVEDALANHAMNSIFGGDLNYTIEDQ
jgi:hypothetical protein